MKTYKKLTDLQVATVNQKKMVQNYSKTIKNVAKVNKKKS
jgi:hypothetical protein